MAIGEWLVLASAAIGALVGYLSFGPGGAIAGVIGGAVIGAIVARTAKSVV